MKENNQPLLSHFSPVLPVSDIPKTISWYQKIGFEPTFEWGDPISYVIIGRDGLKIHISQKEDDYQPSTMHTHLYFFVHDVDALYQEFISQGLSPSSPKTYDYGMRDFDLTDCNGFILCFGKGTEE